MKAYLKPFSKPCSTTPARGRRFQLFSARAPALAQNRSTPLASSVPRRTPPTRNQHIHRFLGQTEGLWGLQSCFSKTGQAVHLNSPLLKLQVVRPQKSTLQKNHKEMANFSWWDLSNAYKINKMLAQILQMSSHESTGWSLPPDGCSDPPGNGWLADARLSPTAPGLAPLTATRSYPEETGCTRLQNITASTLLEIWNPWQPPLSAKILLLLLLLTLGCARRGNATLGSIWGKKMEK